MESPTLELINNLIARLMESSTAEFLIILLLLPWNQSWFSDGVIHSRIYNSPTESSADDYIIQCKHPQRHLILRWSHPQQIIIDSPMESFTADYMVRRWMVFIRRSTMTPQRSHLILRWSHPQQNFFRDSLLLSGCQSFFSLIGFSCSMVVLQK